MTVYNDCYFFKLDNDRLAIQTSRKNNIIKKEKDVGFSLESNGDIRFLKDEKNYYYPAEFCKEIQ